MGNFHSWRKWAFPLIFLVMIFVPFLDHWFHFFSPVSLAEKRKPASAPNWKESGMAEYLIRLAAFFNDQMELRNRWVAWNNYIKVVGLGVSPIPRILLGKNGFMFLAQETDTRNQVDYYRNMKPFSPEELEQWRIFLENRKNWLASLGVQYLLLFAPSKMSIYPEMLPNWVKKVHEYSRLDQLVQYLQAHSTVQVVDVRRNLLAAKVNDPVYYSTGSHWNGYGAFIAFEELTRFLSEKFPQATFARAADFRFQLDSVPGNDYPKMLGLENIIGDREVRVIYKAPSQAYLSPIKDISPGIRHSFSECPQANALTAVMVHDSFITGLKPLLAEQFSYIDYFWNYGFYLPVQLIKEKKPNLFIDEMGERFLLDRRPKSDTRGLK